MDYQVVPVAWDLVYPVHPDDPIGRIRRRTDGFHARLGGEDLGVYPTGDAAAEAIWARFLEQAAVQHETVARMHGSRERG